MPYTPTQETQAQAITLKEYLQRIKQTISANNALMQQWVVAEISDFRYNRHCYMQLLEKDANGTTIATIKANLWAGRYSYIQSKFSAVTGQQLGSGMKVMFNVSANMSEQYGLSVVVNDIYPEFTLGDMQRIRQEILKRLTDEGLIDLNKELAVPEKPQRIAVISAAGAAGYGDFCNQLANNDLGIKFYTCLFAATMQGADTPRTVSLAIERANAHSELFDVLVIIRGGGATNDLNSFDNYDLAKKVAECKLPVIVGIGHERDTTVLDFVASQPVKTPTAAAELIIGKCNTCYQALLNRQKDITNLAASLLRAEKQQLSYLADTIPALASSIANQNKMMLNTFINQIPAIISARISAQRTLLFSNSMQIQTAVSHIMTKEQMRLENITDKVTLLSPQTILNRGYSLTTINGHAITSTSQIKPGDTVVTKLKDGALKSQVTEINQ